MKQLYVALVCLLACTTSLIAQSEPAPCVVSPEKGLCSCADQFTDGGSSIAGTILVEGPGTFNYTFPKNCGETQLTIGALDLRIGNDDGVVIPGGLLIDANATAFTLQGFNGGSTFKDGNTVYQNNLAASDSRSFQSAQNNFRSSAQLLPVTLFYWGATTSTEGVHLTWASISETDNDYYAVEYSRDGRNFTPIGRVEGKGSFEGLSHYSYTDVPTGGGTHYYRLTQYDYDGTHESFAVKPVKYGVEEVSGLYPNPAGAGDRLTFSANNGATEAEVYYMDGRAVGRFAITENGASQSVTLPANLPGGIYVIRIGGVSSRLLVRQ